MIFNFLTIQDVLNRLCIDPNYDKNYTENKYFHKNSIQLPITDQLEGGAILFLKSILIQYPKQCE